MNSRWIAIAGPLAAAMAGCVEREMTITSEPQGALVLVSEREVGRTPVTIPFTWYGDYDVILRMDGHETLTTHAQIDPPWYEIPPLDLLSHMAPWTYSDQRFLNYRLRKLALPPDEKLIEQAEQMRKQTAAGVAP